MSTQSEKSFNLDINKKSRVHSNVWVLVGLITVSLVAYGWMRDVQESQRLAFQQIVQSQKDDQSRYQEQSERYHQQEKHFEYSDARVTELEKRSATTERVLEGIAVNVSYLREKEERK